MNYPVLNSRLRPTHPSVQWVPGLRRPGDGRDLSPPCSSERKNEWSHTPTPTYALRRVHRGQRCFTPLTLILLMWRIWWASNNASRWQMGFISVFKGLIASSPSPVLQILLTGAAKRTARSWYVFVLACC